MIENNPAVRDFRDPIEWAVRTAKSNMPPLMISCAITGGPNARNKNPYLPRTVDEQIEAAYQAYQEGAVAVHVHLRNPENLNEHIFSTELFNRFNEGVRKRCPGMIVNNSTGTIGNYTPDEKICMLECECLPDIASLNPKPEIKYHAQKMKEKGVKPEAEIFNESNLAAIREMARDGILEPPFDLQLAFGPNWTYPSIEAYNHMINVLPKNSIPFTIGLGPYQLPMNILSIVNGGHCRVGLEDNAYLSRGVFATNGQLVERIRQIAELANRPIATCAQAREMLGLRPAD